MSEYILEGILETEGCDELTEDEATFLNYEENYPELMKYFETVEDLEEAEEAIKLLDDYSEDAVIAFIEHFGIMSFNTDAFINNYMGYFKDDTEFAYMIAESSYVLSDFPERYFNIDLFTEDLFEYDYYISDEGHVFFCQW